MPKSKSKKDPNGLSPEVNKFLADVAMVSQSTADAAIMAYQRAQELKRLKKRKGLTNLEWAILLAIAIVACILLSAL